MLPQDNSTILEKLQIEGLVLPEMQLEVEDIIDILLAYQTPNSAVLIHASLGLQATQEATQDPALTKKMNEAIDILREDTSKHNVLFPIGHAGHWYLGEAFYDDQEDVPSIKFTLHDVRPDYSQSADQNPRNQQHVIRTFAATADAIAQTSSDIVIKTTPPHFKDRDDVDGNGYNCGDLVITRGLLCMGRERDAYYLLTRNMTPEQLRARVIIEAIPDSDDISEDDISEDAIDIEFVNTPRGVAALNKRHPNYDQNKRSLTAPAPAPRQQQTSSSGTYADLQPILEKGGELAKELGDTNKQKAFVAANKAMNDFIDRNIGHDGNIANFEEQFDAMTLKSGPTT